MTPRKALTEAEERASRELAGKVLATARLDPCAPFDGEELASELLEQLVHTYGGEGIYHAMLTWSDEVITASGGFCGCGDCETADAIELRFMALDHPGADPATSEEQDVDSLPPQIRWAGRWLAARAALDLEQAAALLHAVPPELLRLHVYTLLHICAHTLNVIHRNPDGASSSDGQP